MQCPRFVFPLLSLRRAREVGGLLACLPGWLAGWLAGGYLHWNRPPNHHLTEPPSRPSGPTVLFPTGFPLFSPLIPIWPFAVVVARSHLLSCSTAAHFLRGRLETFLRERRAKRTFEVGLSRRQFSRASTCQNPARSCAAPPATVISELVIFRSVVSRVSYCEFFRSKNKISLLFRKRGFQAKIRGPSP